MTPVTKTVRDPRGRAVIAIADDWRERLRDIRDGRLRPASLTAALEIRCGDGTPLRFPIPEARQLAAALNRFEMAALGDK